MMMMMMIFMMMMMMMISCDMLRKLMIMVYNLQWHLAGTLPVVE